MLFVVKPRVSPPPKRRARERQRAGGELWRVTLSERLLRSLVRFPHRENKTITDIFYRIRRSLD